MRVLFLYPRTLDEASSVGGVAEFLSSLTPQLNSLGVQAIIYAGDKLQSKLVKQQASLIDEVTVYNGPFIKPSFFVAKRKLAPVLQVCHDEKIDVVHAQGTYTAGFMARQIYKHTRIPYVVTSHSDILTTNSKRMRRRNVQARCRHVLRDAAAVTHLTPMMEQVSHQLWDTRDKSTIIGNGIDCQSWQAYTSLPEQNYLLGIGRLERGKGFHILIDMYAALIERGVTASLIIAGKGKEEKGLQAQVENYGLNLITDFNDFSHIPEKSVVFTGYVRDEVKKRLIAQSKVILFATQPHLWEEAFGIVQLEAMAAGKPIVASDTNVTRFLEQSGLYACIVDPEDVESWANQTMLLLNDTEMRRQSGLANLQAVAQFDWQPIAEQYQRVYATVK